MGTGALRRIYLDTNILRKSGWPDVSAELRNLFILCSFSNIQVCLPEAVESEIEQHWIREFRKTIEQARSQTAKLPTVFERGITVETRSIDDIVAEFRAAVQKDITTYKIERVPFSSRSLRELFDQAIRHTPPFFEKGSGFQDSVILHSIVEHNLSLNDSKETALVTTDERFAKAVSDSKELGPLRAVLLARLISTLKEAAPLNEQTAIQHWDLETKSATVAIEGMKREVAEFVATKYGGGLLRVVVGELELHGVEVKRVFDVTVPIPAPEDAASTRNVRFSFRVEVDIQMATPTRSPFQAIGADFPAYSWTEAARTVFEIEADAKVVSGGYTDVQLLSLRQLRAGEG